MSLLAPRLILSIDPDDALDAAPPRTHTPPRTIRGVTVQIVGRTAYVALAGAVYALPVTSADAEAHHAAVAEAVGMARDTVAGWVTGQVHGLDSNPGFAAVLS